MGGFDTLVAKDGATAIQLFRENGAEIGLVLLDLSMPGLSGEQTFEELRRLDPTVRVLLSSGYARGGGHAGASWAGAWPASSRSPTGRSSSWTP